MPESAAVEMLCSWLPHLSGGRRVVLICPQESGQDSDPTHVSFLDAAELMSLAGCAGLRVDKATSFPLPRWARCWWIHNETVLVATKVR
jgi:hypothetical protein